VRIVAPGEKVKAVMPPVELPFNTAVN